MGRAVVTAAVVCKVPRSRRFRTLDAAPRFWSAEIDSVASPETVVPPL
jgi:hypothetical protein